ncbi:MAG: hypothetical protein J6X54_00270 [Treponema sp.]|nr:hypothetical protein [Treponema sp.]
MKNQITQTTLKQLKEVIIESLCKSKEVRTHVKESLPEHLQPYAHINPFDPDAEEQIGTITRILHPKAFPPHSAWIQKLVDKGLVDEDGKTVLANSLLTVATAIIDNEKIVVQKYHLSRFINPKTNKPYSSSHILKTLDSLNSF